MSRPPIKPWSEMTLEERMAGLVVIMVVFAIVLFVVFVLVPNVASLVSDNTSKPHDIMEAFAVPGDENSQFILIGVESVLNGYSRTAFFVDRKTGVEYVQIHKELTPRYNPDGSLIIHPEYIMEGEV